MLKEKKDGAKKGSSVKIITDISPKNNKRESVLKTKKKKPIKGAGARERKKTAGDLEEKGKMMIMWTGIPFFMVVAVFLLALNLKIVFNKPAEEAGGKDIKQIMGDLGEAVGQMKNSLKTLEQISANSGTAATTSAAATVANISASSTALRKIGSLPASDEALGTTTNIVTIEELRKKLEEINSSDEF